jgi:hypothetical protein
MPEDKPPQPATHPLTEEEKQEFEARFHTEWEELQRRPAEEEYMRRFRALSPEEQQEEIDRENTRMRRGYEDLIRENQRQARTPFPTPDVPTAPASELSEQIRVFTKAWPGVVDRLLQNRPPEVSDQQQLSATRRAWMQERHPDWGITDWRSHTGLAYETLKKYQEGVVTSRTNSVRGTISKAENIAVSMVPE